MRHFWGRLTNNVSILNIVTLLATVGAIAGVSLKDVRDSSIGEIWRNSSLPLLIFLLIVLHVKASKYKEISKASSRLLKSNHFIAHRIRKMILASEIKAMPLDGVNYERDCLHYRTSFRKLANEICMEIYGCLRDAGVPISHVCLKFFNAKNDQLILIGETDGRDPNEKTDKGEVASENPFFMALKTVHKDHGFYCKLKAGSWIPQNQWDNSPRFLAFSSFSFSDERVLQKIASEISLDQSTKLSAKTPDDFMAKIREGAGGRYKSCLGVLSTDGDPDDSKSVTSVLGFIGIGSDKENAWDNIGKEHIHFVSGIADLLCHAFENYACYSK